LHWQLIAGLSWFLEPANWLIVFEVALGIGMVIFLHELGHFAVAKACGVKCEKFYLGFDIGGWKLCKFRWGETEYGIGVLPLGGYVKMLGQDDNPSRLREETERSKLKPADGAVATIDGAAAADVADSVFDPRSYLAKSVPQRMAIISAGVIMNVIFAFVAASIAYGCGVKQLACVIGKVVPGDSAWQAGIRQGDDPTSIDDIKNPRFRDLQTNVALGDHLEKGVDFTIRRDGKTLNINLKPDTDGRHPTIGVTPEHTATLRDPAISPYSVLAPKTIDLKANDQIVGIAGEPVASGVDVDRAFYFHRGPVDVTVERPLPREGDEPPKTERVTVELPSVAMKTLGIVMEMGPVVAVQHDSPARSADIRPGDYIKQIDGRAPGDPTRLPERLGERAGETVTIMIERAGQPIEKQVKLGGDAFDDTIAMSDSPVAMPVLGLAYRVENKIAAIERGGPAAQSGLKAGDQISSLVILPPDDKTQRDEFKIKDPLTKQTVDLAKVRWPAVFRALQGALPGTKVELILENDGKEGDRKADDRKFVVELAAADGWLSADRDLVFDAELITEQAGSVGEALRLGLRETKDSLSLVFRFLRKIFSGQVSARDLGGPFAIAQQAGASASEGGGQFLVFLAMLSANLAVLNFLPIPLLDGGHMVFLAAEGVRGKPVSENVVSFFQFAGLFLLASLMIFVFLLDVGLLSRG
jgi:regulator of sigma E protease